MYNNSSGTTQNASCASAEDLRLSPNPMTKPIRDISNEISKNWRNKGIITKVTNLFFYVIMILFCFIWIYLILFPPGLYLQQYAVILKNDSSDKDKGSILSTMITYIIFYLIGSFIMLFLYYWTIPILFIIVIIMKFIEFIFNRINNLIMKYS